jgi:hypothetical protein
MVALTLQVGLDPTEEGGRERAHAAIDAFFDAVVTSSEGHGMKLVEILDAEGAPASGGAGYAKAGAATKADRIELGPEELRGVFEGFETGVDGLPLNEGERTMLRAIAERAPEPLPYDENREILGSGAKFGNVSSGLARRFHNRGFELPYEPTEVEPLGYMMSTTAAAVVLAVLEETPNIS